jgi:hypothetical protein
MNQTTNKKNAVLRVSRRSLTTNSDHSHCEELTSSTPRQVLPTRAGLSGALPMSAPVLCKRRYRFMGLDWSDPEMRRAYDREQQRRWRAANKVKKERS